VKESIEFTLFGPIVDNSYWLKCKSLISQLPRNIKVVYKGEMPHDQLKLLLPGFDLFFLPTNGENYGHAIVEAILAKLPVLVSDLTPWRNLQEKGIGWDIPLADKKRFAMVLEECAKMGEKDYKILLEKVSKFTDEFCRNNDHIQLTRLMLKQAVSL
jgi:glycosyltransferase involved in cell wall biosynthesis